MFQLKEIQTQANLTFQKVKSLTVYKKFDDIELSNTKDDKLIKDNLI